MIIPAFNSADYLREAVGSALSQSVPPSEIIVIDDGSTDNICDVIGEYGDSVRYFRQVNSGPAVARNRGIVEARGELIAFLDADDVWTTDKLERQLSFARQNPDARLIHTAYREFDSDLDELGPPRVLSAETLQDGRIASGDYYGRLFRNNIIIMSTVMVYKRTLEDAGGFDETIRRPSTEDYDLWLRLSRHHKFGYLESPLTYYRRHSSNATNDCGAIRENELYVIRKAVMSDPSLEGRIGKRAIADRLFELHYELGYRAHDVNNQRLARNRLLNALRYRPWDRYTWCLMVANCLPERAFRLARGLKQSLEGVKV
ncbi:MAG: glycosyltransferase family A protein [Isosphaeraceae bacterium]